MTSPVSSERTSSGMASHKTQLSPVFPLLVAITADTTATAAIRMTQMLAQECGAVPTVLRVVHGDLALEAAATGAMGGVPETALDPSYRSTQLTALQHQVEHILGALPPWHYDIEVGATVPTLVSRTRDLNAELVILGLPQHNFFRRAFVRDTVQGVVESAQAAVLALRPDAIHRPTSILVAVDFSPSSLRAAHLSCQLVAPGGRIILVYVQPVVSADSSLDATRRRTDATTEIESASMALINELTEQKTITITSVVEHGNSIQGVKDVALRMQPDVIALGAHHRSTVDWFFGDTVSTNLVSERQWSFLIAPA